MFVSDNSLKSVKAYFNDRLQSIFSDRELKLMFQLCVEKRLNKSTLLALTENVRLSESDLLFFRSVVKRLLDGEPFQYIHGDTLFYDLILKTDSRALIPRPETEELVDWIVQSTSSNPSKIIDFCSGSGCIALALKSKFTSAIIEGYDVSTDALKLSQENAIFTKLDVVFKQFDLLADTGGVLLQEVDLIVSNPPYVLESDKVQMHANVLDFEPHLALFVADENPLQFYKVIAEKAQELLKDGGWLYFEIHEKLGEEMIELLRFLDFEHIDVKQDLQGKDRMIRGQKK